MIDKVSFFIFRIEILLKTMNELYKIRPIAHHNNYIYQELIFYCQALYNKKIKSALSRLYIINRVFLANNIL